MIQILWLNAQNDDDSLTPSFGYNRVVSLCIGLSKYKHHENLKYAHKDALEFEKKLKKVYPNAEVTTLTNSSVTEDAIHNALKDVLKEKNIDLFIFFFSGHGGADNDLEDDMGYLLIHKTLEDYYMDEAIDLAQLKKIEKL